MEQYSSTGQGGSHYFKKLLSYVTMIVVTVIFYTTYCQAYTYITGDITSNTTWTKQESPIIVSEGVLVIEGITLKIDPGVVVMFETDCALSIAGALIARGISTDMITFTSNQSNPVPGDWGYIIFQNNSVDAVFDAGGNYVSGSILEFCNIKYGGGVPPTGNPPAMAVVRIENSSPFVNRCLIENNDNSGILVRYNGAPKISNNTIRNNWSRNGGGIFVNSEGATEIVNNVIKNNIADIKSTSGWGPGGGGIFSWGASTRIHKNIIIENSSAFGGGVCVQSSIVKNNFILNNSSVYGGAAGVYLDDGSALFQNNVVAGNSANRGPSGVYARAGTTVSHNSILYNQSSKPEDGVFIDAAGAVLYRSDFTYNTVAYNVVPSAMNTGGISVNSSLNDVLFNNIFSNVGIELYNNSLETSANLIAEYNWWGYDNDLEIRRETYDWRDNAALGLIDYSPWESDFRTDTPISPPRNLSIEKGFEKITLTWSNNSEADTAGYKVYWDTDSGFSYTNMVDVGNTTTYTIENILSGTYYVSVTAYDNDYNASNDEFSTLINESQTDGNESWYSKEKEITITNLDSFPWELFYPAILKKK